MTNNVVAGTAGGTLVGIIFSSTFVTTCVGAIAGATLAFFTSLFWKYLMSNVNERLEIKMKLKALIPFIKEKHRLEKQIKKLEKKK
ncbi:MAG TPA: hypothetical protein VJ455_06810 [Ignavibacteria bacterium]|nr:hypothetical protein [Ignavibacteria bacterium]